MVQQTRQLEGVVAEAPVEVVRLDAKELKPSLDRLIYEIYSRIKAHAWNAPENLIPFLDDNGKHIADENGIPLYDLSDRIRHMKTPIIPVPKEQKTMMYRAHEVLLANANDIYVAMKGDHTVGNAWVRPLVPELPFQTESKVLQDIRKYKEQWGSAVELRSFVVDPEYRGNGVAGYLHGAILEDLQARGVNTEFTLTRIPEAFEKYGFKVLRSNSDAPESFKPIGVMGITKGIDLAPSALRTECGSCQLQTNCPEDVMYQRIDAPKVIFLPAALPQREQYTPA